jgi:YidC/Oxa1 family membrane protein insertase
MQKMAPKVAQIQEKYKKDPKRAQLETMTLYKQHGVNPLGGCFPLLIQMPFLIGMFDLLKSTFELRGASFIPGWIDNLTAPDIVFSWGYPIWFFGTSLHLLPILLGVIMYFQQQMTANLPKDPKQWTDQQRQQRFMGNMMVLVFGVLFYHFPSGLNIYWLFSMLFGMLQQWWTANKLKTVATDLRK